MLIRAQKHCEREGKTYYNSAVMRSIYIFESPVTNRCYISAVFGRQAESLAEYTTKQQAEDELEQFKHALGMGAMEFQFADDEPEDEKKEMKNLLSKLIINILYNNSKKKDKQEEEKL